MAIGDRVESLSDKADNLGPVGACGEGWRSEA